MKNQFIYYLISSQLQAFGSVLRAQDSDDKGNDDLFGHILSTAGAAILSYVGGNEIGFKRYLKLAADSIYDFLGLVPPAPSAP